MKLPWVSRDAFDLLADQHRQLHALFGRQAENWLELSRNNEANVVRLLQHDVNEIERAEKRYAELMASYRMLKLQGHAEAVPYTPIPLAKPIDPVEAAIREECRGKDAEVVRQMRAQVAIDRTTMNDDEVIALIRRGNRPAEELAS